MGADVLGVTGQRLRLGPLVGGLGGIQERAQRDLGVDEDVLALGQIDSHVGPQGGVVRGHRVLQVEVAAIQHAGQPASAAAD